MEEGQNSENQNQAPQVASETPNVGVSFPTIGEPKKSGGAKTLLIVGILVLVGILGFVIYKSAAKKSETPITEPTAYDNLNTSTENQATPTPVATATAKPADKTKIKIQIQNGTGITGEAAYLQTQLKGLGYTSVSVGNASESDLTATQVSFASTLASDISTELTTKLSSIYQSVTNTSLASSSTYDIVIVTGLRKGATAKPSASPSATPTATPKASPTATPQ